MYDKKYISVMSDCCLHITTVERSQINDLNEFFNDVTYWSEGNTIKDSEKELLPLYNEAWLNYEYFNQNS